MANINIPGYGNVNLSTPAEKDAAPQDQFQLTPQTDENYLMGLEDADLQHLVQNNFMTPQSMSEIQAKRAAFISPELAATGQPIVDTAMSMLPKQLTSNELPKQALFPEITQAEAQAQEETNIAAEAGKQAAQEEAANRQVATQVGNDVKRAQRIDETEKQVAADQSKEYKDNKPSAIGQAIAIMMGALSQGLTGAKLNPAIEAIDKVIEREATKKKYDEEQKMALRKHLLDEASFRLRTESEKSDSALKSAQIAKIQAELASSLGEVRAAQETQARLKQGTGFSAEEIATMGPDMANRMVQVKPGIYMPTASKNPQDLRTNLNTFDNAMRDAKELRKMAQQFGNNSIAKIVDREARGQSEALLQGLVGALRLPYFGPGVLTDTEQRLARDMIGNPTSVFSLASANEARINTIIQKLNYAKKTALRNEGVNVPLSANEQKMAAYRAAGIKLPDPELINAMIKKGDWNPDEE